MPNRRIVVAITGATGSIYGYRLLQRLHAMPDIETHLIISAAGAINVRAELDLDVAEVNALADIVHKRGDISASIASGSFKTDGMYIAPCSMKTLAAVATGFADNLVSRAADVILKERRPLLLLARETPLNLVHLRNMTTVTEMGGIIFPPVPSFYSRPETLDDVVDHTVDRMLDLLSIDPGPHMKRWQGLAAAAD